MNNIPCSTGTRDLLEALLHLARNFNGPPQHDLPFSYEAPWHCLAPGNFKVKKKVHRFSTALSTTHGHCKLPSSSIYPLAFKALCLLKSTEIYTEVVEAIQHMLFMNVVGISKKPVNLPWDRRNLRNLFNQKNTLWKDTQTEKPTAEVWTTRHEKIRLPGVQVWAILSQTTKEAWLHGLSEQLTDLGQEITSRD